MPPEFDIFVPGHSPGLMVDADVLCQALGRSRVRALKIPYEVYGAGRHENDRRLKFRDRARRAILIERIFDHPALGGYEQTICVANPEWLTERDLGVARALGTEFWHKTRHGLGQVSEFLPGSGHKFIGFTSPGLSARDTDYDRFAHFAGKSRTRHTQQVLDIWRADPGLPDIRVHSFGGPLHLPEWVTLRNVSLHLGFMEGEAHAQEFARHGVHLCTSQVEGFGHYINEARSMGALIITLDAPPMNELVDRDSGILIAPDRHQALNCGVQYFATGEAIRAAVDEALGLSQAQRRALGQAARHRFVTEGQDFVRRLRALAAPPRHRGAARLEAKPPAPRPHSGACHSRGIGYHLTVRPALGPGDMRG
jgi:hypothetical protein